MDCKSIIKTSLEEHKKALDKIFADENLHRTINRTVEEITKCFKNGGRLYLCGNGGSAADAQHIAAELSGRFLIDRKALPAEALHCNTSYITAVANDYSYDSIFERLISGIAKKGDILMGLSTSGNSENILKAYSVCREKGILTISLTGESGGKMKPLSDILINIPSRETPRIQELHITIGHIICQSVETELFGKR